VKLVYIIFGIGINLQMDPKNFEAYLGIAYAYQKLNKPDKACESINNAKKEGSQTAQELKNVFCKELEK
jgi:Tfp pilus assembly protein PilF